MDPDDVVVGEGPALDSLYNSEARSVCFACSVAELLSGLVLLATFWAAYGWTIIHAFVAITTGSIGWAHYRNRTAVGNSSCCCYPTSFITNQPYVQGTLAVFTLLGCIVSVIAAFYSTDSTTTALCVLNILACITLFIASIVMAVHNRRLNDYAIAVFNISCGNVPHIVFYHGPAATQSGADQAQVYPGQPVTYPTATVVQPPPPSPRSQQQQQQQHPYPSGPYPPQSQPTPCAPTNTAPAYPPGYLPENPQQWYYQHAVDGNPYVSAYPPPTGQSAPLSAAPSAREDHQFLRQ